MKREYFNQLLKSKSYKKCIICGSDVYEFKGKGFSKKRPLNKHSRDYKTCSKRCSRIHSDMLMNRRPNVTNCPPNIKDCIGVELPCQKS